ncbi:N-acetyltransferase [Mesonia sp.]|uniref:N-acetyltransferase n=1 Tax=Mesonia sp. TaxID=1960830 RepID=UPI003F94D0CA
METIEVKDNEFLRQFEIRVEEELITLEYSLQERKIFLSKILISDEKRADGTLEKFLTGIFDHIEERGRIRVVPTSKEVVKFFRANKSKYTDLLPIGMNI